MGERTRRAQEELRETLVEQMGDDPTADQVRALKDLDEYIADTDEAEGEEQQ